MARFIRVVDEWELRQREEAADRALYAADPDFALALGYLPPRTRAGSPQHPTARAVRALPNVLRQSLARRPLEQLARLRGTQRMIGAPLSSLT